MDLRQLKNFIAVAEERNIGRAALRVHLSQPPLTRQIHALESDLGVQLFTRTPRGVDLTQAGEALLKDARSICGLADQAAERAQLAGRGQVGRLDIGVFGTAMFDVLPRLLSGFGQTHPQVKLVLHHDATPAQVTALRQGRVLLVFERMVPNEADIAIELVARERLLVALHQSHRLAGKKAITMQDLRDEPMIMQAAPLSQLANVALDLCRASGFEPKVSQLAPDVVTGALMVSCGMGTLFAPESMRNLQLPNLVCRPLKGQPKAFMDLHCYYLKAEQSPLLVALLKTIREFRLAQKLPANAVW
jgi:LysR family transcriptional regulator, benzoate and cis,cis-muconate-responsive activator of ben and cat genes